MVATAGIALGISGVLSTIAMTTITRHDGRGNLPNLPRVNRVALVVFLGSLAFFGAVLVDVITSPAQAVVLGLVGLGGALYLGAGAYHLYAKRQEANNIKWFKSESDEDENLQTSAKDNGDDLNIHFATELEEDLDIDDPSLNHSPVERY